MVVLLLVVYIIIIEEEFKFAPNDKIEDYKQDLQNKKEEIYSIITKVKCLRKEIETLDNQIKGVREGNKEHKNA